MEEMFRTLRQNGKAHPNMNHGVVESQFSELPAALKETLSNTMQFGVRTGIPTPEKTTQTKESKTTRDNRETVWKHLRKCVANGWLRAFPPSSAWILSQWRLRVSSTHFVDKTKYNKARLITDLGNPGGEGEGQDANTLSPDLEYANVQADYIDDVADAICKDMKAKLLGLGSEELAAIKADIKQHSCRYRFTCVTLALCACPLKAGHLFSSELPLVGSGLLTHFLCSLQR